MTLFIFLTFLLKKTYKMGGIYINISIDKE